MNTTTLQFVGFCGLFIYGIILGVSLWRLYWSRKSKSKSMMKVHFHLFLCLMALFDVVYSISLVVVNDYTSWGYSFHIVAMYFNLLAFTEVMAYWSLTMEFGGQFETVRIIVLTIGLFCGIVSLSVIAVIVANGFYGSFVAQSVLSATYAAVLLGCAVWMFVHGVSLMKRLRNHQRAKKLDLNSTIFELLRINLVLLGCVACYALRALALIFVFLWNSGVLRDTLKDTLLEWFVVTLWIPQLFPDLLLLFLLRERATSDSSKDIEVVIRDSGVRESIGIASAHVVNSHGLYSYQSVEAVAAFYSKSVAAPAISMTAMDGHEFFSRFSTVSINPLFRGRETTASVEGGGLTMTNRPTRNDLTRGSSVRDSSFVETTVPRLTADSMYEHPTSEIPASSLQLQDIFND